MAILSKSGTAELAGVSQAAVTKGLAAGKLVETADHRIDTVHPQNARWLADRLADEPAPDIDAIRTETRDISGIADRHALEIEKLRADIRTQIERERTLRLKREALEGTLAPREYVEHRFAGFSAALRTNLLLLPRRVADHVTALARSTGPRDVEQYLAAEIEKAIETALRDLGVNP